MRYTKKAMTLAQQIQTLQSRGLTIADTNKTEPDLPPVWKTLEVISLGELSKLFNNFSESRLKHNVAHEFGLNAIDSNNTFVGDLKLLLLRNPSIQTFAA